MDREQLIRRIRDLSLEMGVNPPGNLRAFTTEHLRTILKSFAKFHPLLTTTEL